MDTAKLSLLRNAMTAYAKRRRALSRNLANIDTPGYDRTAVTFEQELQEARTSTGLGRRPSAVTARVEVQQGEAPVLENELMALSDTQMRTQLASRALSEHFDLMRTGITGQSR
jgi:flagellar basal-body rod protein FlgB